MTLETGQKYAQKTDIWSFGILCLELAEGKPPHLGVDAMTAVFYITKDPAPKLRNSSKWSPEFQKMIARCLIKDHPAKRPSCEELLEDPFIKKAEPARLKKLLQQSRSITTSTSTNKLDRPKPMDPSEIADMVCTCPSAFLYHFLNECLS